MRVQPLGPATRPAADYTLVCQKSPVSPADRDRTSGTIAWRFLTMPTVRDRMLLQRSLREHPPARHNSMSYARIPDYDI